MDERGYYILNKYIITAATSPEKIEINILYKYIYRAACRDAYYI
jgi:hypothetical protein